MQLFASAARAARVLPLLAALAGFGVACVPAASGGDGETDADPSPNAKILPAPLATQVPGVSSAQVSLLADPAGRLLLLDAGAPPPPEPMRPDRALTPETSQSDDQSGVILMAEWKWRDVPGPPDAGEVAKEGIAAATELLRFTWNIEMSEAGRMRVLFDSDAMLLPRGTELRARSDRYGHLLIWPDGRSYRVVAPGALRTVLGERRVDVTPLGVGRSAKKGAGKRLDLETRIVEIRSSYGLLALEFATVHEAGAGSELLCRALLEIAGVSPELDVCQLAELPLAARFDWQNGGGIDFEITQLTRRVEDLPTRDLMVPPAIAEYRVDSLPASPAGTFATRASLAALRKADAVVEPLRDAPPEGLVAKNGLDEHLFLLLDGLPVVAVPPLSDRYVVGPRPGSYTVQWRTFLGDRIEPPTAATVPGRVDVGVPKDAPDAGAP